MGDFLGSLVADLLSFVIADALRARLLRRRARRLGQGHRVVIRAYLQEPTEAFARRGRLHLRTEADGGEWHPWPARRPRSGVTLTLVNYLGRRPFRPSGSSRRPVGGQAWLARDGKGSPVRLLLEPVYAEAFAPVLQASRGEVEEPG